MKLTETVLALLGLEPVTNRQKLMEELEGLDGAAFLRVLGSDYLTMKIDCMMCEDCKAAHGDRCPCPGDKACAITNEEWLEAPCTRETLIGEA